jgi:broad specificity phosphatase PhoE
MRLYLVRHAEPEGAGVFMGRLDPPLSKRGRESARRALTPLDVLQVYASPLRRATETAAFLAAPCTVLPDLAEISFGDWEGRDWESLEATDPELAARKMENWFTVTPPGGEPWPEFRSRVLQALAIIRQGPDPCAVIAHAGVNAVLAEAIANVNPADFHQSYGEIISYEF